jgi:hypothetical protein
VIVFAVGQDFPGKAPLMDGAILEMGSMGDLWLIIQMNDPTVAESAALRAGFSAYSLYLSPEPPGIVVIAWKYPVPVGYLVSFFHGGLYTDGRVKEVLNSCDETNALTGIFLDGPKITWLSCSGLNLSAMAAFRQHIATHSPLSQAEYRVGIERLHRFTPKELFGQGIQYQHGRKE